jgi:hypothetical protein
VLGIGDSRILVLDYVKKNIFLGKKCNQLVPPQSNHHYNSTTIFKAKRINHPPKPHGTEKIHSHKHLIRKFKGAGKGKLNKYHSAYCILV